MSTAELHHVLYNTKEGQSLKLYVLAKLSDNLTIKFAFRLLVVLKSFK